MVALMVGPSFRGGRPKTGVDARRTPFSAPIDRRRTIPGRRPIAPTDETGELVTQLLRIGGIEHPHQPDTNRSP